MVADVLNWARVSCRLLLTLKNFGQEVGPGSFWSVLN